LVVGGHMRKKSLPTLKSDAEAETFVVNADLTDYDLSSLTPVSFELKRKDKSVNLRLPDDLLAAVRARALKEGIPYQRFIRMVLERALLQAKS
jgi:predicted DNA binding CopG/RHH family protein